MESYKITEFENWAVTKDALILRSEKPVRVCSEKAVKMKFLGIIDNDIEGK